MKKLLLFLIFTLSFTIYGQDPDILIASNLKKEWSHYFTRQIRTFLDNVNINDPLKTTIEDSINIYDGVLTELLDTNTSSNSFLKQGFGLDLSNSLSSINVNKLYFEFKDLAASFKYKELSANNDVIWKANINGRKLIIGAEDLNFKIDVFENQSFPPVEIKIKSPSIKIHNLDALKFYTDMSLIHDGKYSYAKFYSADFKPTIEWLLNHPDQYDLTYERLILPDLKLKVGSKVIAFEKSKLEELIQKSLKNIKELLTDLIIKQLENGMGLELLKNIENYYYQNEQFIQADSLVFSWNLKEVSSLNKNDIISFEFQSHFCLPKDFEKNKHSCHQNYQAAPRFPYDQNAYSSSIKNIEDLLVNNDANLVFSFSENYFNRLLKRTIDGGYWEDALKENELSLGPLGVFARLDNNQINIYMDTIYLAKKSMKKILGTKDVRFPIKINMDFRIENRQDINVFIIKIKSFDMSQESLIKGYNELGLKGLEEQKRLRKLTANKILKKLEPYQGTDIFLLPIPVLKDLELDNVIFQSDSFGRFNASLKYQN